MKSSARTVWYSKVDALHLGCLGQVNPYNHMEWRGSSVLDEYTGHYSLQLYTCKANKHARGDMVTYPTS